MTNFGDEKRSNVCKEIRIAYYPRTQYLTSGIRFKNSILHKRNDFIYKMFNKA